MVDSSSRQSPVGPFISIDRSDAALERVHEFLEQRSIRIRTHDARSSEDGSLWDAEAERSYGRMAHGFMFTADWLGSRGRLDDKQRAQLGQAAHDVVRSWQEAPKPPGSMAFHDETTAQRVIDLVAFLHDYHDDLDEGAVRTLHDVVDADLSRLTAPSFYAGVNNHGMFQDIALLVAAELYRAQDSRAPLDNLAFGRLYEYFSECFTVDGIHIENSPTYHVMVSRYLKQVVEYAIERDRAQQFEPLSRILEAADLYAAHATTPTSHFPPVSDTAATKMTPATARNTYSTGALLGALTQGRHGTRPEATAYVAEASGYAIHRSAWSPEATYVFFSAAYNADYHKHSDELSVYISDGRREILREAGPFGYDRKNPFAGYGFSSQAHNTMLVDGRGLPRTDGRFDDTSLTDLGSTDNSLALEGSTDRFPGIRWSRRLDVGPDGAREPIQITDTVRSAADHRYTFLWHFGPDLRADVRGSIVELFAADRTKVAELVWKGSPTASVRLRRGKKTPRVQGWVFPRMGVSKPADVLEVDVHGGRVDLTWELRTHDFLIVDRKTSTLRTGWKHFGGEKPVRYLLKTPTEGAPERLLVSFSAIRPPWDFPADHQAATSHSTDARLFILDDFGSQGAYYLSSGREHAEFRSVQRLITAMLTKLGLDASGAVMIGSTKGATAAIMHGVALGAGRVVAAAPHTRIGTYLESVSPMLLEHLAGGTSDDDIEWADSAMERALTSGDRSTPIEVVVGERDHHRTGHVDPFAQLAERRGYALQVHQLPGTPHRALGGVFRGYLESVVDQLNGDAMLPHAVGTDQTVLVVGASVGLPDGALVAFELLRDGQAIDRTPPGNAASVQWTCPDAGRYRVRFVVRLADSDRDVVFTSRTVTLTGN